MTSKNRKHLDDEQLTNPEPEGEQKISRVLDIRGGNIVEIEYSDKRTTLCMIPSKYRKKLWIRKGFSTAFILWRHRFLLLTLICCHLCCFVIALIGSFLIVDPAPADDNYKVQARIAHVLNADQVKHLKSV